MKKNRISEATGSGSSGRFKGPIQLAPAIWEVGTLEPFIIPVSEYVNPDLAYDSYDGTMEASPSEIKRLENLSIKMAKEAKKNFGQNDDDGNPFNGHIPQGSEGAGTPEYIKKISNLGKLHYQDDNVNEGMSVWNGPKRKSIKLSIKKPQNESLRGLIGKMIKEQIQK